MDGGGIAETGRGADVIVGQPDNALTLVVPHGQTTTSVNAGDGPTVAVFDPVGGSESEPAVVAAGDDHISDTRLVPIRQANLAADRVTVEAMITGATVELADELAAGGHHDGVKSGRSV